MYGNTYLPFGAKKVRVIKENETPAAKIEKVILPFTFERSSNSLFEKFFSKNNRNRNKKKSEVNRILSISPITRFKGFHKVLLSFSKAEKPAFLYSVLTKEFDMKSTGPITRSLT